MHPIYSFLLRVGDTFIYAACANFAADLQWPEPSEPEWIYNEQIKKLCLCLSTDKKNQDRRELGYALYSVRYFRKSAALGLKMYRNYAIPWLSHLLSLSDFCQAGFSTVSEQKLTILKDEKHLQCNCKWKIFFIKISSSSDFSDELLVNSFVYHEGIIQSHIFLNVNLSKKRIIRVKQSTQFSSHCSP